MSEPAKSYLYRPNRAKAFAFARLEVEGEAVGVTLVDISRDGAKLRAPYPLLPGTALRLTVGEATISGLVAWYARGFLGVRFLERFDPDTLLALETGGA